MWGGVSHVTQPATYGKETKSAEEQYDEVLVDLLTVATGSNDANLTISAAAESLIDDLEPSTRERQFINAYMSDLYVAGTGRTGWVHPFTHRINNNLILML